MKKEFFINKREQVMKEIEDGSIVVLFAGRAPYKSADEIYRFTPNRNFYYLTGIDKENIILMMHKRDGVVYQTLFVERNDPEKARWVGAKLSQEEAQSLSGVQDIAYIEDFHERFQFLFARYKYDNLYLDLERAEWDIPKTRSQEFAKEARERYPFLNIKNIYHLIGEMRTIKSEEEIECLRKAIKITEDGIYKMMENIKPGMMEYQVEAYFDFVLLSNGVRDRAFKNIIASGKNAATLHYSTNDCPANDGELIQFDLGAQYGYYNGDISRAIPVNGKFTQRQRDIYNVVLRTNEGISEFARPGITFKELHAKSEEFLAEGCKQLGLIKDDSELHKYYFHSITHQLGMDDHDVGLAKVLAPGMVISNEPGLYIPEEGIGIRIEDDLLITENGCEVLTKNMIRTAEEIEEYMAKNNKWINK